MTSTDSLRTKWREAAEHFSITVENTELSGRLPTQRELEEHWSLIQAYIESYDDTSQSNPVKETHDKDTHSISSYSHGPEYSTDSYNSDVHMTAKHTLSKARKSYTLWENDLIWQAYNKSDEPEKRRKELTKVASQLGRSYNGIAKHLLNLRKNVNNAPSERSDNSDTESTSTTSSSSSMSQVKTTDLYPPKTSVSTNRSNRVRRGAGFQYTEEEEVAIWAAYLSTTNKTKQEEALRAVAQQYGRTFGAVRLHLSIMRDAQFTGLVPTVQKEHASLDSDSASSKGKMAVNQVSDLSDSDTQHCAPSARSKAPVIPPTTLPITSYPAYSTFEGTNSRYMPQTDNSFNIAVSPYNASPANKYGHSEMSLNGYRNTVRADVYAPETVNNTLGGFMKTLRAEDMDLIFPIEAHDQALCIILACFHRAQRCAPSISHHRMFTTIAAARTTLQSVYFHLHGVSNAKLHRVLNLLRSSNCATVHGGRWAEQQIHMDPEIRSIAILRRRHDRCLARRMRPEHRAYLEDLLLWPLEAMMANVERALDGLAKEPRHSILRL